MELKRLSISRWHLESAASRFNHGTSKKPGQMRTLLLEKDALEHVIELSERSLSFLLLNPEIA
uniref:Putative ovule protein n=1 Tax=Solanum chacoense TaxID=4108 RepID=A0A0V0HC87_SOLCH